MKKNKFSILILMLAAAVVGCAQTTIEIINQYPFDRANEIVEIAASELGGLSGANYILTNENNQEIPYQLIYNGTKSVQSLVFPATVKTGTKVVYTLNAGTPKAVKAKPKKKDE